MATLSPEEAEWYEMWTGYRYSPKVATLDDITLRVLDSLQDLTDEADVLGLLGPMREIHLAMDIAQLDPFTDEAISAYNDLFYSLEERGKWENSITSDRNALMNKKLRRHELMRLYGWVRQVLFLKESNEYPLAIRYFTTPTVSDILDDGVDFYFPRVGEATVEGLTNRYETYELLVMCGWLNTITGRAFILGASTYASKDEIAALVLDALSGVDCDPRCILTHTGPLVLHRDDRYNLYRFDPDKLPSRLIEYGIPSFSGPRDAQNKLILAMLDKNFFIGPDVHREIGEQVNNYFVITKPPGVSPYAPGDDTGGRGRLIEDVVDPLFFGTGDGVDKYDVFSQEELAVVWMRDGVATNPATGDPFSLRQLSTVLMLNVHTRLKAAALHVIAQNGDPIDPDGTLIERVSKGTLIRLFNAGAQLSDLYRDGFKVEVRAVPLSSASEPVHPLLRARPKANVRGILQSILAEEELSSLWLISPDLNVNTTDLMFTLRGTVYLLNEAVRYALWDTISYFGNYILATAEYYMKRLYGMSIAGNTMEFDETAASIRNEDIIPGDW